MGENRLTKDREEGWNIKKCEIGKEEKMHEKSDRKKVRTLPKEGN